VELFALVIIRLAKFKVWVLRLKIFDDRDFLLKDVRYIPELKRNLISISMSDGLGYCTIIERGTMRISHGALVIAKWSKIHGLYILEGSTVITHALVASVDTLDITKLWHLGLGHVSDRGLKVRKNTRRGVELCFLFLLFSPHN